MPAAERANRSTRRVVLATVVALLMLTSVGCSESSGGSAASGKAPAGLLRSGQLAVCINPEYPPMEYLSGDGDPVGFDADAARALAGLWDVRVEWQKTSFDGLMPALQGKRCDILWSALYLSPERTAVADGTPFLATGSGLLVRAGETRIRSADDLSGRTVAVLGGGANEATLTKLSDQLKADGKPAISIQAYPKNAETVAAVTNGKADALIETDVAVVDIVSKSNGALVAVPKIFPVETKFGIFTRKGSPLTAPVVAGIKTLHDNGTLNELAVKYGLDPARLIAGQG